MQGSGSRAHGASPVRSAARVSCTGPASRCTARDRRRQPGRPKVTAGFSIRRSDGKFLAARARDPALRPAPDGTAPREAFGVPLDGAPPGHYEVIVVVTRPRGRRGRRGSRAVRDRSGSLAEAPFQRV